MKESDVRNHLSVVREEIKQELRRELGRLTTSLEEVEEEWNELFKS